MSTEEKLVVARPEAESAVLDPPTYLNKQVALNLLNEGLQWHLLARGPTVDLYTSKKGYLVPWHYVAGAFLASDPIAHSRHGGEEIEPQNNTNTTENSAAPPPVKEDKKIAADLTTIFIVRCGHIEPLPLKKSVPSTKKLIKIPKQPEFKILNFKFTCKDSATATAWVNKINAELERRGQKRGQRFRCYVNPFGGKKKAPKVCNLIRPLFEAAGHKLTVVTTQFAGHCEEDVRQVSLDDVDGVFTISGDGLLNECVNGLMGREDAVSVLKRVKVGTVPGGTGNALAAEVGGMHPIRAALAIIKGESRPLDLIALYQPASKITFKHGKEDKKAKKSNANEAEVKEAKEANKKSENNNVDVHTGEPWKLVRYGFMGLLWGLMADVDIESERWRWMGDARLILGGLIRILDLRQYEVNMIALPNVTFDDYRSGRVLDKSKIKADSFPRCLHATRCNYCRVEDSQGVTEIKTVEEVTIVEVGNANNQVVDEKAEAFEPEQGPFKVLGLAPGLQTNINIDPDYYLDRLNRIRTQYIEEGAKKKEKKGFVDLPSDVLEKLDLPQPWYAISGSVAYFGAMNIAHASGDMCPAPYAHFSDGSLDMIYTLNWSEKMKILGAFAGDFETGEYLHDDYANHDKVRALIMEPIGKKKGIVDLDGEMLGEGVRTAIEVHRGVLNVYFMPYEDYH